MKKVLGGEHRVGAEQCSAQRVRAPPCSAGDQGRGLGRRAPSLLALSSGQPQVASGQDTGIRGRVPPLPGCRPEWGFPTSRWLPGPCSRGSAWGRAARRAPVGVVPGVLSLRLSDSACLAHVVAAGSGFCPMERCRHPQLTELGGLFHKLSGAPGCTLEASGLGGVWQEGAGETEARQALECVHEVLLDPSQHPAHDLGGPRLRR